MPVYQVGMFGTFGVLFGYCKKTRCHMDAPSLAESTKTAVNCKITHTAADVQGLICLNKSNPLLSQGTFNNRIYIAEKLKITCKSWFSIVFFCFNNYGCPTMSYRPPASKAPLLKFTCVIGLQITLELICIRSQKNNKRKQLPLPILRMFFLLRNETSEGQQNVARYIWVGSATQQSPPRMTAYRESQNLPLHLPLESAARGVDPIYMSQVAGMLVPQSLWQSPRVWS